MRSCGFSNAKPAFIISCPYCSMVYCFLLYCMLCLQFSRPLQLYQSGLSQPCIVINISLCIKLLPITAIYIKLHYTKIKLKQITIGSWSVRGIAVKGRNKTKQQADQERFRQNKPSKPFSFPFPKKEFCSANSLQSRLPADSSGNAMLHGCTAALPSISCLSFRE